MKSRAQIKEESKVFIRTGQVSVLVVSAIVIVVGLVLSEVSSLLDTGDLSYKLYLYELGLAEPPEPTYVPPTLQFVSILVSLVNMILNAGYLSYLMGIRKGRTMPYSSLLDGLGIAGKVIWCNILVGIKIFLWSLLFVIPGLIASYRYRFALYNIIENPQMTASEAIALSCRQTEGWKMELFILDWSLFGWDLLQVVTGGIAGIWVRPYRMLTDLGYYEMCSAGLDSAPHSDDTHDQNRNDTPWEF